MHISPVNAARGSVRVDRADLPDRRDRIRGDRLRERIDGGSTIRHCVETPPSVRDFRQRLRRDRADAGARPRHDPAHRKHARLHRDTELARLRIARNN